MGINQNNIARNETNYIIEKFFSIVNSKNISVDPDRKTA